MLTGQLPFKGEYEQAVVYSILNEEPERVTSLRSEAPLELEQIIKKAMRKNSEKRYSQVDEIISSLRSLKKKLESLRPEKSEAEVRLIRKKRLYIYGAITILALSFIVTAFFLWRKTETGRIKAIVSRLKPAVEAGRFDEVFEILNYSGVEIKDDRINTLTKQVAGNLSIQSTPPRARVTLARVRSAPALSAGEPIDIGLTPIKEHMLVAGEYFVSMMLENMMPVEFLLQVVPGESLKINRTLLSTNKELSGMVKIEKGVSQNGISIPAFLIDKHEVTNAEFFDFVSAGGYREKKFWPENIIIDGLPTPWESAIRSFVDKTGISCPRFWSGAKYPEGEKDHPVVGISWYEARAYAHWAGKDLPTWDQLWLAALGETDSVFPWGNDVKTTHLRANFGLKGTQPVGSYPLGVSPFGCFDMAGNVREWLRDSASRGKLPTVVGGSWKDPSYMFEPSHAESFYPDFASGAIGFRCVKSISDEK
jgi:formylglycine-generating enzyme required for sulfatase activity